MFGQFPEQATKEGRLKGGCEVDPLVRDNFVNQEKHANRKKKWDEVFKDGMKDEADIQRDLE
jgi:hypothetical protein